MMRKQDIEVGMLVAFDDRRFSIPRAIRRLAVTEIHDDGTTTLANGQRVKNRQLLGGWCDCAGPTVISAARIKSPLMPDGQSLDGRPA